MLARVTLKFKFIRRENKALIIFRMERIFRQHRRGMNIQWHGIGSVSIFANKNFFLHISQLDFCSPLCKHAFRLRLSPFFTKNSPGSVRNVCVAINSIPEAAISTAANKIFTAIQLNFISSRFHDVWRGIWTPPDLISRRSIDFRLEHRFDAWNGSTSLRMLPRMSERDAEKFVWCWQKKTLSDSRFGL